MNSSHFFGTLVMAAAATLVIGLVSADSFAANKGSREEEALWISEHLKPIPDAVWKEIAGEKSEETYEIIAGDTLYDVSKRLFGDAKYWPKIWALNNGNITNPHLIRPKNKIHFVPGTGTSLPTLGLESAAGGSSEGKRLQVDSLTSSMSGRSTEWKKLPKQSWEIFNLNLPSEIDSTGLDRNSKVKFGKGVGITMDTFLSSELINTLGKVTSARGVASYFFIQDTVFIEATDELQVGETYTLVDDPDQIEAPKSGRKFYSYALLGNVRIVGIKDNLYIGTITHLRSMVGRGAQLIHLPPRFTAFTPIPGSSPIEASVMIDSRNGTATTAQHKQIFVDRGSDDGVRPGMVFRVYQHQDPKLKKPITESDFIVLGDVMVVQVAERASIGIVVSSQNEIENFERAVLLTDVSDITLNQKFNVKSLDAKKSGDLEAIDQIDVSGGLGKKEADELRQLEVWQKNKTDFTKKPEPVAPTPEETPVDEQLDAGEAVAKEPVPPAPIDENAVTPPVTAGTDAAPVAPGDAPAAPQVEAPPSSVNTDESSIDDLLNQ
jgi:hypothetical protein